MPANEFDPDDPLQLNGISLTCREDTTGVMAECFIEEFMRLGYNAKQILALFRNPHYRGMNLIVQNRGEAFVREKIAEVFLRRGRPVAQTPGSAVSPPAKSADGPVVATAAGLETRDTAGLETCATLTDPMGAPIPDVTI
jgi:hypothetical protein